MLRQVPRRLSMPKKLTKALRGKRRWIGCTCDNFPSRNDLRSILKDAREIV